MGYPKSKNVIKSAEHYLKQMLESKSDLLFPASNGQKFQYAIHAAIHASKDFARDSSGVEVEPFYSYSKLLEKYRIRTRENDVICELRSRNAMLALRVEEMRLPGLRSAMEIIGAAIQHKNGNLIFPDAQEGSTELEVILKWANQNNCIVEADDAGLKIIRGLD